MHLDAFSSLPCHPFLVQTLQDNRVAHLYIFSGAQGRVVGRLAQAFLLDYLNVPPGSVMHPDLFELRSSGKAGVHAVEQIREVIRESALMPHSARGTCFLFYEAERMLPASSQALLKICEEPAPGSVLVMVTQYLSKILPTIRSRAQVIRVPPGASEPEIGTLALPCPVSELPALIAQLYTAAMAQYNKSNTPQDDEEVVVAHIVAKQLLENIYLHVRPYLQRHKAQYAVSLLLDAFQAIETGQDPLKVLVLFGASLCCETREH